MRNKSLLLFIFISSISFAQIKTEEPIKVDIEEKPAKVELDDSLKVKQVLNNMGFNSLDFSLTDLDYIKRNLNQSILEKNVKLVR